MNFYIHTNKNLEFRFLNINNDIFNVNMIMLDVLT